MAFVLRVVDSAAVCVWTISVALSTTMLSSRPPISSFARTVAGAPAVTITSLRTLVLNPVNVTVTV
jgi:hypothetical protein